MAKVYLDNCCFNRPFDNQAGLRVRLETEAKLEIQEKIQTGQLELVWSYVLDFENNANPFEERKQPIAQWREHARFDIEESNAVLKAARRIIRRGIRAKDALHIACAVVGGCDYFLTTDDELIRKMSGFEDMRVANPAEFIIGELA
jgi:predicted nucleic acid-binding protein